MATKTPSGQETDGESLAEKRARWEHLRLAPCPGAGKVNVCNYSYGVHEKNDHTHTVSVESGIPFDCTCADWQYNNPEDGCKHMLRVGNAPDIMAEAQPDVATDGGHDSEYIADCADCAFNRVAYESRPAHDAKDRHQDDHEGHNVVVQVDEGTDGHIGAIWPDGVHHEDDLPEGWEQR